jgi:hypothetical protein
MGREIWAKIYILTSSSELCFHHCSLRLKQICGIQTKILTVAISTEFNPPTSNGLLVNGLEPKDIKISTCSDVLY